MVLYFASYQKAMPQGVVREFRLDTQTSLDGFLHRAVTVR
jgi:hypothetical protein